MDKIIGVVGSVPSLNVRNDDDFASRLSHYYSTALCIVFAVVVSTKQYVGEPITCWVPAHFTGNHEEYTNNYCWIRNTYYLPFTEYIPKEHEDDKRHMVPYYQWMPLILLVQALIFYMPILLWRSLSSASGVSIDNVIDAGHIYEGLSEETAREKIMKAMTNQMNMFLNTQQNDLKTKCTISLKHVLSRTICICCGRRQGNYLTVLYFFTKLLFVGVTLGQLFALNWFLGFNYHHYGIDVVRALANGEDWMASPRFPRVTMCDFKVRRLGNLQRYTVQCVLPINLFNEKIYLFLWFWLVAVSAILIYSFLNWLLKCGIHGMRKAYITKQLQLAKKPIHDPSLDDFIDEYLRMDGIFALRLIAKNRYAVTVTDLIGSLWEKFKEEEVKRPHVD